MARKYEDKTKQAILQQMLDATPAGIDKREGSITWDMLSPAAVQMAQAYIELDNVLELVFAETSNGEFLEMRTAELGVERKPALRAVGQLKFTGPVGTFIPVGTRASTTSIEPVLFETTQNGTIGPDGFVIVNARAVEGGVQGNISAGAVTVVVGNLAGIVNVINEDSFNGGVDRESDEELLARYYQRVRQPGTSGNKNHYLQWAKEVPGISDAQVYPLWDGPLTVKVIVIDGNKRAPTPELLQDVTDYIEEQRPIGAIVTVEGAEEVPIDISVDVALASDTTLQQVKEDIENAVREYLAALAFTDPLVRITRIASIILDIPRIVDYQNLTMNNDTVNLEVQPGQVAVLGTVNVGLMDE